MTQRPDPVKALAALQPLLADADHYDCKSIEGAVTLREFLAGMFNYYPAWMKALYRVRWGFVRLLGMKQEGIPAAPHYHPADISFEAGAPATFFTVTQAEENHYWVASASESHLSAYIIALVEPLDNGHNRFHVATVVHYGSWAGPIYFNVIRPFHHLVVRAMMRAGVAQPTFKEGYHHA